MQGMTAVYQDTTGPWPTVRPRPPWQTILWYTMMVAVCYAQNDHGIPWWSTRGSTTVVYQDTIARSEAGAWYVIRELRCHFAPPNATNTTQPSPTKG